MTDVETATVAASAPLVEARDVYSGYHGHAILRGFSIEVRPGEVVALLGPNGAGKSTALLTLAGELRLLSGEVVFHGSTAARPLYRRAREGMGFVTEERSIFPNLSVEENLLVGRCEVEGALEFFPELRSLLSRRGGLLSGGEQQMLSLARALARRPSLLLVDELSLGLAPLVVKRLLQTVRRVADELNVGVLLVEQHVKQALRVADRVVVLRAGAIVLEGTVAEVEGRLEHAYLSSGDLGDAA
jgi:branched-chain amino acid transport system ATP-binding protein